MARARRILHLIETLGHGGAEHQLALNASGLQSRAFENVVAHLRSPNYLTERIEAAGVRVHDLDLVRRRRNWPRAIVEVAALAKRERADLIHTSLFEADVIGGAAGRLAGVPVVNTFCNIGNEPERLVDAKKAPDRLGHNYSVKNWAAMQVWGSALRRFDTHHIAISNAVQQSAVRTYKIPKERMTVIYRALPEPTTDDLDRETLAAIERELGTEDAYPILLNVGRLAPQKGQRYAVEALPEIVAKFPKTRLLIVGQGWLQDDLTETATRLGVAKHLQLLGRREDVPALMALSDLFVFPSNFEGLGVALLQAAAAGMPCIASNVGPLPEVLTHRQTGLLVPPRDPLMVAKAVIEMAGDRDQARRLGDAARARTRSFFTIARMLDAHAKVYDEVLHAGATPRT